MGPVVLFDLDGTLTDPALGITRSYQYALASEGVTVDDPAELVWMIGPPIWDNLAALGLDAEAVERAVLAYRVRHIDIGLYECEIVPGMPAVLRTLWGAGHTLGVATAKPTEQAVRTLEHFGIARLFAAVGGATLDGTRRHKSEIIAHTLDLIGGPPADGVVMVGDRRHDIEGARACGIVAIGVRWGYGTADELDAARPDHIVATPEALAEVILSWP
jgi:phosphoglycolate phosphatase